MPILKEQLLNETPDDDTKKVESEGRELSELVDSPGWLLAKQRISDKILDIQSVLNIETTDATKLLLEVQSRKMTAQLCFEWLKEIESIAEQYKSNKVGATVNKNGYIVRL